MFGEPPPFGSSGSSFGKPEFHSFGFNGSIMHGLSGSSLGNVRDNMPQSESSRFSIGDGGNNGFKLEPARFIFSANENTKEGVKRSSDNSSKVNSGTNSLKDLFSQISDTLSKELNNKYSKFRYLSKPKKRNMLN